MQFCSVAYFLAVLIRWPTPIAAQMATRSTSQDDGEEDQDDADKDDSDEVGIWLESQTDRSRHLAGGNKS